MRTRVKICGITSHGDAKLAINAGADAIGLVFYSPSPRAVTIAKAQDITARLPPFITVVGLFVNESRAQIATTLKSVRIDVLQFHGDELPVDCIGHGRPWIKAISMRETVDLSTSRIQYEHATALLLDTYMSGVPGGTGSKFDWTRIPSIMRKDIILAGGLTPETVEQAVCQVRPYAVDVSGGVERSKGIKDADKIAAFMRGIEAGDRNRVVLR